MQNENIAGEMVVKVHAAPCNHDVLGLVTSSHSESVACLKFRLSNRANMTKTEETVPPGSACAFFKDEHC